MNKKSCYWRLYKQMCRKAQVEDFLNDRQNLDTVDEQQRGKLVAKSGSLLSGDCAEVPNKGVIWW